MLFVETAGGCDSFCRLNYESAADAYILPRYSTATWFSAELALTNPFETSGFRACRFFLKVFLQLPFLRPALLLLRLRGKTLPEAEREDSVPGVPGLHQRSGPGLRVPRGGGLPPHPFHQAGASRPSALGGRAGAWVGGRGPRRSHGRHQRVTVRALQTAPVLVSTSAVGVQRASLYGPLPWRRSLLPSPGGFAGTFKSSLAF